MMPGNLADKRRATILVPIVVLIVVAAFFLVGYIMTVLLQLPFGLGLSLPIRLLGAGLLSVGFGLLAWLFRYRRPVDVLLSTYLTFYKLGRRIELKEDLGRKERFVARGPYKLVRHPMYVAVLILLVGWGLLLDWTFLLFAALVALLWFNFVVMPYEERELLALYGRDYEEYMKQVRRILPIRRSVSNHSRC